MNVCVQCKYCVAVSRGNYECKATTTKKPPCPVTGKVEFVRKSCFDARTDPAKCGESGRWFVKR